MSKMIATILPGSPDFHAVGYNERKVAKGSARLLEMLNFGSLGALGTPTPEDLVGYLRGYSSRNDRIRKPQFHVAISCKGHEMTETQLLVFAHQYLREMGYMGPGHPLLVYSHYDTENTHLHIVTSRIAPNGRKVDHSNERRRSQMAIDRILGNNRKRQTENDLDAAMQYTFSTFAQFKAVMVSMGYEVYAKDETVYIKHGGMVRKKLSKDELDRHCKRNGKSGSQCRQLRSILLKYRDICTGKEELQKEMREKFGIDIVFFGRKDSYYGYMIVDHRNRTVINGMRVLAVDELLDFATPEERLDRIEDFIDRLFSLNPMITQSQIYSKIWRQHAYIKKGVIHYNGKTRPLKPFMADAIDRNNRIAYVEDFNPGSIEERDLLCKIYKVEQTDLVSISLLRPQSHAAAVKRIHEIFDDSKVNNVRGTLYREGFIIRQEGDSIFAVNFNHKIIVNLTEEGFDTSRLQWRPPKKRKKKNAAKLKKIMAGGRHMRINRMRDTGGGSRSDNREWEVGRRRDSEDLDDGQSLKR